MWNERYAGEEYVYGTEPNAFLAEHAKTLTGPSQGVDRAEGVRSLDAQSAVPLQQNYTATLACQVHRASSDLTPWLGPSPWLGRQRLYPLVERSLKPGGLLLLEAYTPAQLPKDTGGPKDPDMLMSAVGLQREFPNCEVIFAREIDRDVLEGGHRLGGVGSVVQFIARKKA